MMISLFRFVVAALMLLGNTQGFHLTGNVGSISKGEALLRHSGGGWKVLPSFGCPHYPQVARTALSATPMKNGVQNEGANPPALDTDAIVKYTVAIVTQMTLFFGVFTAMDQVVAANDIQVPFVANALFFYAVALKSRVFNPLSNKRPDMKTFEVENQPKRIMPTWSPPGFVFPIVWLGLIGPIRAITSAMVYESTLSYAHPAIFALLLHLSIGDVWNTINNVERRYGAAVSVVALVWASKAFAAWQYYNVNETAGQLLGLTLIWFTVALTLIARTRQLNPDPQTGQPEPFYPFQGKATTQLEWFATQENK